jgi:hypothetical protein
MKRTLTTTIVAGSLALGVAAPAAAAVPAHEHAGHAGHSAVVVAKKKSTPTLVIDAMDYKFSGPKSVKAGTWNVKLVNTGTETHQAALFKLKPGKTLGDVLAAAAKNFGDVDKFGEFVAGPNSAAPGGHSSSVTVNLKPGNYLVVCLIPSPDGTPHVVKGMSSELKVTGKASKAKSSKVPAVHLKDFQFKLPKGFSKLLADGKPFDVVNDGPQAHEIDVVSIAKGKTIQDVISFNENPAATAGPPPFGDVGGTTVISKGGTARLQMKLKKGNYALICFIPDVKDQKPHFMHGMVYPVTVR